MIIKIYPNRDEAIRAIEQKRSELLDLSAYPDENLPSECNILMRMVSAAKSYSEALNYTTEEHLETATPKQLHRILFQLSQQVQSIRAL
ncbi:MAG: hypothetical protein C0620_02555 [Desulfuromonas sp.]|jgi:hypothetical protein|nr:MAG: hypothetical protein C0620_02555 [Desulfuromonas sp.]